MSPYCQGSSRGNHQGGLDAAGQNERSWHVRTKLNNSSCGQFHFCHEEKMEGDGIIPQISVFNSRTKHTFMPVLLEAQNRSFLPLTPGCFHLFCQPLPCQPKDMHY